jgi:hypothetical protein
MFFNLEREVNERYGKRRTIERKTGQCDEPDNDAYAASMQVHHLQRVMVTKGFWEGPPSYHPAVGYLISPSSIRALYGPGLPIPAIHFRYGVHKTANSGTSF